MPDILNYLSNEKTCLNYANLYNINNKEENYVLSV